MAGHHTGQHAGQHAGQQAGRAATHGPAFATARDVADHAFDEDYWNQHWQADGGAPAAMEANPANPHLVREIGDLAPGTALDAGCGASAEAIWLASRGWEVTGADIAGGALARAAERAAASGVADRVSWVRADLSVWEPAASYDLVTTHYAHPAMPQLEFYDRVASWVAPGGTLLIVGHLLHEHGEGSGHGHRHEHAHGHRAGHGEGDRGADAGVHQARGPGTGLDP